MNRILFCGDTHGDLSHIAETLSTYGECDAVVHVGDFELQEPLSLALPQSVHSRFWWIPGNHDFDRQEFHDRLFKDALASRCFHLKVIEMEGLRIAGLGGTFKGRVWRPPDLPTYKVRRSQTEATKHAESASKDPLSVQGAIWPEDFEKLAQRRADVLVTHEAPSCHQYGFKAIDQLAERMGASLIVHGHHHLDYVDTVNNGKTKVIGVGLRGISDLNGPMKVSMTEFQKHFERTLDLVQIHDVVQTTIRGVPKYALLSIKEFERMEKMKADNQEAAATSQGAVRNPDEIAMPHDAELAATLAKAFYDKRSQLKIDLDADLCARLEATAKPLGVPLNRYIECLLIAGWMRGSFSASSDQ